MRLYLMRHAIAVPQGTRGFATDAERPLTKEGRLQAWGVAEALKRLEIDVEIILTSPYLRARQTAEQVARVYDEKVPLQVLEALIAETAPRATSMAIQGFANYQHALFVGHEPHLSAWLGQLVAEAGELRCVMKKGGVACVEIEEVPPPQGSGTLRWLLTPKQLMLIGKNI